MTIREIAYKINDQAKHFEFGKLQDIRKRIKGLSKKASSNIFTDLSISEEGWAFHFGGRTEIQFNISIEGDKLRYGLAFSLETSRSLPNLNVLYPKILKLNSLIRNEPDLFLEYKMWFYRGGERSKRTNVYEINDKLPQQGTFIFFGKLMDLGNIHYDEILSTFDDMLVIYQEVETEPNIQAKTKPKKVKFKFDNRSKKLPTKTSYNTIEKEINVDARHSYLQEKLYNHLIGLFGEDAVGLENKINGNRIDIVVKKPDDSYLFYEVKTGSSAKSCIRQGIGQLLEYAYWNNSGFNATMIIAGEYEIDKTTSNYIRFMKNKLNIPISYYCIE